MKKEEEIYERDGLQIKQEGNFLEDSKEVKQERKRRNVY